MISLAFSPCPNDTFMLDAWVHKKILNYLPVITYIQDIQALNEDALAGKYDVTKISVAMYPLIQHEYELLPTGAALGYGCGPLLVATKPYTLGDISSLHIALPGEYTTAHLLLKKLLSTPAKKSFHLFSAIEKAVLNQEVDAGMLIHEGRFTYQQKQLYKIVDMGELWEKTYQLPLPLGVIAIKRNLPTTTKKQIYNSLYNSIQYAFHNPEASASFVAYHAQEMDIEVRKQHIQLYVNDYSLDISTKGEEAIQLLLGKDTQESIFFIP